MKILKNLFAYCLLPTAYCLMFTPYASAAGPFIADISVTNSSENLALSARLKGGFTNEIVEIIHSGAPATFTYYIELMRYRSGWTDSSEYSKIIKRTVKYDVLMKEYKFTEVVEEPPLSAKPPSLEKGSISNPPDVPVNLPVAEKTEGDKKTSEKITKDFEELKKWLSGLESIKLAQSKQILPGNKYYISIKADLKTIKLWFPFNYIFFFVSPFVSLWDVTTDWEVSSPFSAD
ncbi:MAG: DUF4390 domain-containing protein [Nitrospinae bacterium]|nr:DUF4390 domain-containing protein [Nitrospinota bacterium]